MGVLQVYLPSFHYFQDNYLFLKNILIFRDGHVLVAARLAMFDMHVR